MLRRLLVSVVAPASAVLLLSAGAFAAKPTPNQAPVVTSFDVADTSPSPIPVLAFTATDADGTVAGYLITESPSRPDASAPGWSPTPPASYPTSSTGSITLYPWAKDDRDAVSDPAPGHPVTVPPAPIDADTLDGKDSTEFAAAAHGHAQDDVTGLAATLAGKADATHAHPTSEVIGLQAALDGKSTVGHTHDELYQRRYAGVVVVARSGGDFSDPIAAMSSITDASASNPYLVKIMPGVYDLGGGTLATKQYLDVEGSGEQTTIIVSSTDNTGTVSMTSDNTELRRLTVVNTYSGSSLASAINCGSGAPKLANVTAIVSGSTPGNYAVRVSNSSPMLMNVTAEASGATGSNYGVASFNGGSATMRNVTASAFGGTEAYGIGVNSGSATMSGITASAAGASFTNFAVQAWGGATISMTEATAHGSGGSSSAGVAVAQAQAVLTDVTATASGASSNRGVTTSWGTVSMAGVRATASGVPGEGYGAYSNGGDLLVDRSTIEGTGGALGGWGTSLKVGASRLVGPVVPGTFSCVGCYDGDYAPLDASCQ